MSIYLSNNKKTIFVIGYPWPYTYGGHRTTKLCRELSKEFKVILITRPLFRYIEKSKKEPFEIFETKGIVSIYDPLRIILKNLKRLFFGNEQNELVDSGLINKINKTKKYPFIIKNLIKVILKIKFFIDSYIALPDDHWPWIISSYFLTKKLYSKYTPFMVISTFPISSHVIASRLKRINQEIKWIAEFPDLWSLNHVYPYGSLRQKLDNYLEKKVMKNCDKLITCQPGWAHSLQKLHNKNTQYIPHCINLKLHEELSKNPVKSKTFRIRYLGTFYKQQIKYMKIFMESFDIFIDYLKEKKKYDLSKISVEFIGTKSSDLEYLIENQKHNSFFKILPKVSYEKSIEYMHDSELLLLPLYFDNNKVINWFSSKIIEYIGSKNKCLVIGDHCDDFKILVNKKYPLIDTKEKCSEILIQSFNNRKICDHLRIGEIIDLQEFAISTLSSRFIDIHDTNNL